MLSSTFPRSSQKATMKAYQKSKGLCRNCWWNISLITKICSWEWSWSNSQLVPAGSIRDVPDTEHSASPRYWCSTRLSALDDYPARSTGTSDTTICFGVWCLGSIFMTSSFVPPLGAKLKFGWLGTQSNIWHWWRGCWYVDGDGVSHWLKSLFAVTYVDQLSNMDQCDVY